MTRLILIVSFLFYCATSFEQSEKSIELSFLGRYDQHADYVSNYAGRVYNDTNKLYGFSYGINIVVKREIAKSVSLYFGLGYYQLRIDKIRGPMPYNIPGTRTSRNINCSDGFDVLYSTPKYHYNNVAVSIGLEKAFLLSKGVDFTIAPEIIGYQTFSQKYKISGDDPQYCTRRNSKPLEFGVNARAGIRKDFKNFYLQPSLIIPVYQNLKGDKIFYEDNHMNISKWFRGIGVSISIGKYF